MDIAIVTGASSALGQAISSRLIQLGFRVYGLGGDYKDCALKNVNFKPLACDLGDANAVESAVKSVLEKEKGICLLVNNAKFFGQHSFAEMGSAEMERILRINLLCPLILARSLRKSLIQLQGFIINLGAATVDTTRGGPVGAAASGGLKWMGEILFQDLRDHGVKVCHISPEPNRGRDARLTVRRGARTQASLDPEAVAQAVEQLVLNPYGNTVTELVLRPLRVNELAHEPIVHLPKPEPQPIPYTVPREVIEAEEQLEEEAFMAAQEKKRARRKARTAAKKGRPPEEDGTQKDEEAKRIGNQPEPVVETASPAEEVPQARVAETPQPVARPGRSRRRRKPKPPMTQVGFLKKEAASVELPEAKPVEKRNEPQDKPEESKRTAYSEREEPSALVAREEAAPKKRTNTIKTARKAAKKTTRKTAVKAVKKTAVKASPKATKKAAPKKTATAKKASRKRATKKVARKAAEESKSS